MVRRYEYVEVVIIDRSTQQMWKDEVTLIHQTPPHLFAINHPRNKVIMCHVAGGDCDVTSERGTAER
jgi:acetone carboxylase gamma subunit